MVRLVSGQPRPTPPPPWLPPRLERAWQAGQRPVLWHTPSRPVLVGLLLTTGLIAAARTVLGLLASPAWDLLLGVGSFALLWALVRAGKRMSLTALGWVRFRSGALYGSAFAALVYLGTFTALLIPAVAGAVRTSAPATVPSSLWLFAALLLVPLGTVLFEELLFRGVVLAWLRAHTTTMLAVLASSALFALWHLPALFFTSTAAGSDQPLAAQVTLTLATTFLAGLLFAWLRLRSGSLLAPVIAHVATNSVGFFALILAWS